MSIAPRRSKQPDLAALQARYDGPIPESLRKMALRKVVSRISRPDDRKQAAVLFWLREMQAVLTNIRGARRDNVGASVSPMLLDVGDKTASLRAAWFAYRNLRMSGPRRFNSGGRLEDGTLAR